MKSSSLVLVVGVWCALMASGCASAFLHGARMARRDTPTSGAVASWEVTACTETNGHPIAMQGTLRYYLLQGEDGLELFEQDASGGGAIITNQWQDTDGTHFYTWVTSNGWEYVIPAPGQPATRRVYASGTTDARPNGTFGAVCPMFPGGAVTTTTTGS
jgi:hypothetical protein